MKHPIGQTKNGVPVYVDLIRSQAAVDIAQQPHIITLVKEALQQMEVTELEVVTEHDMGRVIGYDFVIATTDKDPVVYARLTREDVYTRFVKNGQPQSTQYLTITLRRDENNEYELHRSWMGHRRPPRPGSDQETAKDRLYWAKHAFVLSNQALQLSTVTKTCPY